MNNVQMYQASFGRRRSYLSRDDANAYDRGFAAFPGPVEAPLMTPERTGYYDAEQAYLDSRDMEEING